MCVPGIRPKTLSLALATLAWLLATRVSSGPDGSWPLDVRLEFRAATFGGSIGSSGLKVVDLDGDGKREIVAAASTMFGGSADFWYVVSRRASTYGQLWVSSEFADDIRSLTVAALDADLPLEVLVGAGSDIYVYDGQTRELQWRIRTTADEIRSLQVVDVDSDGSPETVFCASEGLYIYDALSGAPEAEGLLDGCENVAVGNVDADAGLEIVLARRFDPGYVLDGATRAVQWAYAPGFGVIVRLGDLDGDQIAEIVAAQSWSRIAVFDARARIEEDSLDSGDQVSALEIVDVEGDGPLEIVFGDGQFGDIHVRRGVTLDEKWALTGPVARVSSLAVGDTDHDGVNELVWGGGSGGPNQLYVADTVTRQVEWQSVDFNGPFYGLAYGDVDANGRPDFLHSSFASDGGYGDGRYLVYGAIGKRLRYVSPPPTGLDWLGLARIAAANLDADPQLEVLVGTSEAYQGILVCYDGLTHVEQWRAQLDDGLGVWSLQVGDVDADGTLEVVMGAAEGPTSSVGMFLYVLDAATGAREWRSPSVNGVRNALSLLRLAQMDADAALEILVAEYRGRLLVFDGVTHVVSQLADDGITALDAPDSNRNGHAEVVVGTEDGELRIVNPGHRRPDRVIGRYGARIDGLAVRDLTGDGIADYTFAAGGHVNIVDGYGKAVLWRSGWLGEEVGVRDSLLVGDIDLDGRHEIMVNTGRVGLDIYEIPPAPAP